MYRIKSNLLATIVIIAACLIIQACATNPVTGKREIMFISDAQELAMGQQADPGIIANFGLYDNAQMQAFINEKGKEMGAISHKPELDYQFRILDSPVVNAFAVPGGYVYFTRGIMAHFNNEAEFAGVLGHEIGHITARHSAAQMSKQQLLGGLFVAGMIVSEEFRQFGDLGQQALGMMFLKFGRDDESQSDELGVAYSTKVGYDSHEMANFFGVLHRIQSRAGVSIPEFQSTHPDPVNRFNKVHEMSDAYQAELGATNLKIGRDSYLRMIDGLTYGEDPKQGYVKFNTFFHPELKFHFPVPPEWQVNNTPQMVQMASTDGKALMLMTLSSESTLQVAAQGTVEQDGLEVLESSQINVNGLPAIAMLSKLKETASQTGQQQQQQDLRILTYLIQYNDLIYKFHGLSETVNFNSFSRVFQNTMGNFDRLTDPARINVTADVIQVAQVNRAEALGSALNRMRLSDDDQHEIAILNNMELEDVLQPGQLIKTIKRGQK